ncbi:prepilin-type N-terminal cleavage/methylation domain-containing protein [Candidatus Daviesbacteria bacterium]|nr:prepilin-type N-terminal cleavage/methylation domain-containing protein [Candidatus Daviesbacteria bacterium]
MSVQRGFTLVELLVTISIISILSVIGITVFSSAQNSARNAKVLGDFDAMYKNIEIARSTQQKTLFQLTGLGCSDCGACRSNDWTNCLERMATSYSRVTTAPLPLDPWGRPYFWDENEGEFSPTDCRQDSIRSAGPDGNTNTSGDNKVFYIPLSGYTGGC